MADSPDGVWNTLAISSEIIGASDELQNAQSQFTKVITTITTTVNQVSELLIQALNVAREVLNIAKAFVASILDPIVALIDVIVDEVRQLVREIRNIGIYVTGDTQLLRWPWNGILGGYSEYERRMIARFTDRTDPTRPEISGVVPTGALFLYTSGGSTEIPQITSTLDQIAGFFNVSSESPGGLPVPVIQGVTYGNDATDVITFGTLANFTRTEATPPNIARIAWKLGPSTTEPPSKPFIDLPPTGFLVTVSTLQDGIPLVFDRPISDTDKKLNANGALQQPREYGEVLDKSRNRQVVLFGGADQLEFDAAKFGFTDRTETDKQGRDYLPDGVLRVWGAVQKGANGVIPLESLKQGDNYYLQRQFFVDSTSAGLQWARDEYSIDLRLDQLPRAADVDTTSLNGKLIDRGPATTYYVRVATIGDDGFFADPPTQEWKYDLSSKKTAPVVAATSGQPFVIPFTTQVSNKTLSALSDPFPVTFTNAHTSDYLEALQTALIVLVLTRSDFKTLDEVSSKLSSSEVQAIKDGKLIKEGVASKATGLEGYRTLIDLMYDGDWETYAKSKESNPYAFRQDLFNRSRRVAQLLYDKTGPMPDIERFVVENTVNLRTVKWSEIFLKQGFGTFGARLKSEGDSTILRSLFIDLETDEFGDPDLTTPVAATVLDFGLALNPFGIIGSKSQMEELFYAKSGKEEWIIRVRLPQYAEEQVGFDLEAVTFTTYEGEGDDRKKKKESLNLDKKIITRRQVDIIRERGPSSLLMLIEPHIQDNGTAILPDATKSYIKVLGQRAKKVGSGDLSPVFYFDRRRMDSYKRGVDKTEDNKTMLIAFCRTLLAEHSNGVLMREAAVALGVGASSGIRSPQDGVWESVRIGDALPELVEFLDTLLNWIEAAGASLKSTGDTLTGYIDFLDARITAMQQLVRRVDGLLTQALSFGFDLPPIHALALSGNGLDGVLADFINAENKPTVANDALAYGAGMVALIPGVPSELFDLFAVTDDPVGSGSILSPDEVPGVFGIESIPEEDLFPPADPEPDVL